MLNYILYFFIFCIVLFFYLHIQFHLKKSNDLEIYELENVYKDKLEELCDFRQPVLFTIEDEHNNLVKNMTTEKLLSNYSAFNINIRQTNQSDKNECNYTPFSFTNANKLFDKDTKSSFYTENNNEFLEETGVIKTFQYNDELFRPSLTSNCYYDFLSGSHNTTTPFRYEVNYRNYYLVTEGTIKIKLTPPKSSKYLHTIEDYENFEFRSPVNPWNVQSEFTDDFNKIKCLEIILTRGKCIYIPAYWYYSIKYEKNSSLCSMKYKTYFNTISIFPQLCLYFLQNQNVITHYIKKIDVCQEPEQEQEKNIPKNPENETEKTTTKIDDLIKPDDDNTVVSNDTIHVENNI
jgi:hypothetical protein